MAGSRQSLCVCPPRAGMPCLASVPACTLSSAPLLMMSTRSCPTWERLSSPRQGRGTSSVGRKRPSAAGPCKPSRSVHSWCCPTARTGGSGTFVPRTSVPGILGGMTSAWSCRHGPSCGWGCRPVSSGRCCSSSTPQKRSTLGMCPWVGEGSRTPP